MRGRKGARRPSLGLPCEGLRPSGIDRLPPRRGNAEGSTTDLEKGKLKRETANCRGTVPARENRFEFSQERTRKGLTNMSGSHSQNQRRIIREEKLEKKKHYKAGRGIIKNPSGSDKGVIETAIRQR